MHALVRSFRVSSLNALVALLCTIAGIARAAGPYATTADGADPRLMLKGYDPVTYLSAARPLIGAPSLKTDFDGVTYRFVTEENRFTFMKNPFKYVPLFGGMCAHSMTYAIPWPGDPEISKIVDGQVLLFGSDAARRHFVADEAANLRLAQRYWKEEVEGSIALVQRSRRLVMRVPHYKSDKDLEAEWRSRNARK